MSAIGPGDWVEYLGRPAGYVNPGAATGAPRAGAVYTEGSLYRVTEVGRRCYDGAGNIWESLRTTETPSPYSVPVAAFRPIYRPNSELIEDLKRRAREPLKVSDDEQQPAQERVR